MMDQAVACGCPSVDVTCVVRRRKRVDVSKLGKDVGGGNLNWFEDLTHQAEQKLHHMPNAATPRQDDLHLAGFDSPCFLPQPVELMQATTPGTGSLTPLSAWALLSSQDPSTSTPTSVDYPNIGNSPCLVSPPVVESCLKTCRGISERLGLVASNEDCNMSWTNSMATPCLGGEIQASQEGEEPPTPPKPKGFPRALFSPDQGRTDSDELVKELNATMEEEGLSGVSPGPRSSLVVQSDRGKNLIRELFLRSTGHNQEVHQGGSPRGGHPQPRTVQSTTTPRASCRKHQRRNFSPAAVKSNIVSPLAKDDKSPISKEAGRKTVIDIENKDIQLKINILQMAASFKGDISTLPCGDVVDKQSFSDTEVDVVNHLTKSNQSYQSKGDEESYSDSAELKNSPIMLNRRVRNSQERLQQKRRQSPDQNSSLITQSVVKEALAIFTDSPSSAEVRRRSAPRKGKKRKSTEACLPEGDVDGTLFSTPSPHGSQTVKPHSILSSSKKGKHGSGRKKVRFAENLCDEGVGANKKLNYDQRTDLDTSKVCSSVAETVIEPTHEDCLMLKEHDLSVSVKPDMKTCADFQPKDNKPAQELVQDKCVSPHVDGYNKRPKEKGTQPVQDMCIGLHADDTSKILKGGSTKHVQDKCVSLPAYTNSGRLKEKANTLVPEMQSSPHPDGSNGKIKEEHIVPVKDKCFSPPAAEQQADGEQPLFESQPDEQFQSCQSNISDNIQPDFSSNDSLNKNSIDAPCKEHSDQITRQNCDFLSSPSVTKGLSTETKESPEQGAAISLPKPCGAVCESSVSTPVRPRPAVHDEMFSQISPSSLTEMCLVANSDQSKPRNVVNAQYTETHRVDAQETISDVTTDSAALCQHSMEHDDKLATRTSSAQTVLPQVQPGVATPSVGSRVKCTDKEAVSVPTENDSSVSHLPGTNMQTSSTDFVSSKGETLKSDNLLLISDKSSLACSGHTDVTEPYVQNLFTKKPKAKRFFYPTSSQIKAVCPKTVFSFKGCDVDAKASAAVTEAGSPASSVPVSHVDNITVVDAVGQNMDCEPTGGEGVAVAGDGVDASKGGAANEVKEGGTLPDVVMTGVGSNPLTDKKGTMSKQQDFSLGFTKFSEMFDESLIDWEDWDSAFQTVILPDGELASKPAVLPHGIKETTPKTAISAEGVGEPRTTSKNAISAHVAGETTCSTIDVIGGTVSKTSVSVSGKMASKTVPAIDSCGDTTAQTGVMADVSGQATSQRTVPAIDSCGDTTTQTGVLADVSGHATSQRAVPAIDSCGDTTAQTGVMADVSGQATSQRTVPAIDSCGDTTTQTGVLADVGGNATSQRAVPAIDSCGDTITQTGVMADVSGHAASQRTVQAIDSCGDTTVQTGVMADVSGHAASQQTVPAIDSCGDTTTQTGVLADGGGHNPSSVCRHANTGHAGEEEIGIVLPVPLSSQISESSSLCVKPDTDMSCNNVLFAHDNDGRPNENEALAVNQSTEAVSGAVKQNDSVVHELNDEGQEQNTGCSYVTSGSQWLPTSQYVHNMVKDVQEELFSDIEFSQVDGAANKTTDVRTEPEEESCMKRCDDALRSATGNKQMSNSLSEMLSVSVQSVGGQCIKSEASVSGSIMSSAPGHQGKDMFKKPDVPGKVSNHKALVFSDSDTDAILSGVDQSETCIKDKGMQLDSSAEGCHDMSSAEASDFESCNSESDVKKETKFNVNQTNCAADSSLSDSETDLYVTSTEEIKELSPEVKQQTPRIRISTKSRTSRKDSVLLSKSLMIGDSDSDVSSERIVHKNRTGCHLETLLRKVPTLVNESDPDILWSDLESHGKEITKGGQTDRTDCHKDIMHETFVSDTEELPLKSDQADTTKMGNISLPPEEAKSPASVTIKEDNMQKPDRSNRAGGSMSGSESVWSDLEQGEAEILEEETVGVPILTEKAKAVTMSSASHQFIEVDEEVQIKTVLKDERPETGEVRLKAESQGSMTSLSQAKSLARASNPLINTDSEQSMLSSSIATEGDINRQENARPSIHNLHSPQMHLDDCINLLETVKTFELTHNTKDILNLSENVSSKDMKHALGGFSSASGKKFNFDPKSLQKASALLETVVNISEESHITKDILNLSENVSSKDMKHALGGFSTASGKKFNFDPKSLQKATALLETGVNISEESHNTKDILNLSENVSSNDMKHALGGFSTASDKKFNFDPKSLQKATALLETDVMSKETHVSKHLSKSDENSPSTSQNVVAGFSTASGKKFNFDNKSLQKATALLETDDTNQEKVRPEQGKCRGNSHSRRHKTYIDIADVTAGCIADAESNLTSFATASGKDLFLNKDAFLKAQTLMEERLGMDVITPKDQKFKRIPHQSSSKTASNTVPLDDCELESMLEDFLKSKKSTLEKHLKDDKSQSEDLNLPSHKSLKMKKAKDVIQTSANIKYQPIKSPSPSSGFSAAGNKGLQIVSNKSVKKGNPMLKAKGFRPFKKPRIVPKPKTVDTTSKHKEMDSLKTSSCTAGGVQAPGQWQTTPGDSATKENTNSELCDMMLLEFSHDMTELSQGGCQASSPKILFQKEAQGHSQADDPVQAVVVTNKETGGQSSERENIKSSPYSAALGKTMTISEEELASATLLMDEGEGHTADCQALLEEELFRGDMSSQLDVRAASAGMEKNLDGRHEACARVSDSGREIADDEPDVPSVGVLSKFGGPDVGFKGTGFQTASGRQMCLSEEALRHAKAMWDDLPISDTKANDASEENATKHSRRKLNVCSEQDHVVPNICHIDSKDGKKDTEVDPRTKSTGASSTYPDQEALGLSCENQMLSARDVDDVQMFSNPFQTASGKVVSVSIAALNQARKGMSECRDMAEVPEDPCVMNVSHLSNAKHVVKVTKEDRISLPSLFQTASGKGVTVSESSLSAARKTLSEDFDCQPPRLFQTASGKGVTVSESSLSTARKTLSEDFESQPPSLFQTTSGKGVTVSESSLSTARKTLSEDFDCQPPSLFATASGKGVTVSESSLSTARKTLSEDFDCQPPCLFQTASGKGVTVSESSLSAARKTLSEDFDSQPPSLFQTASGKGVTVSESSLSAARKTLSEDFDSQPPSLFKTASGKGVTVDKQSLAKTKKLMKDVHETQLTTAQPSSLFQTASGNAVTVSESALVKSREMFTDEHSKQASKFKTASGTSVSVSSNSLDQAKSLFKESVESSSLISTSNTAFASNVFCEQKAPQTSHMFQTASGSAVGVSANALVEAQRLLQDDHGSSVPLSECLFQTASGTSVGVSANALVGAQEMTKDNQGSSAVLSKSLFQTASGSCVGVSTVALAHGRRLLVEVQESPTALANSEHEFQTASGRGVPVSESSLESSRKLLDEASEDNVVPELKLQQTRSHQKLLTTDGQRRFGHRSRSKTPVMSSPESTHLDRLVKGGRRLHPVLSTSLSTTHRSDDYDLDAILNKSSEKRTSNTNNSFKTPYKNTAFVAPVRKASDQNEHTQGNSNKTPVFYPRAALRANQKQSRNTPTNHNKGRLELDKHCSCRNSPSSSRTSDGSGNDKTDRPSIATFGEDISGRSSPLTMEVSSVKAMSTDDGRQQCESFVSDPLRQNTGCVGLAGGGLVIQPGKVGSVQACEIASASTDLRHQLEESRQKQGEIIQRKKKQKVRPSCGRLFSEKQSAGMRLQYRDLAAEGCFSDQELCSMGVRQDIIDINSNNAEEFRFNLLLYYPNMKGGVLVGDGAHLIPDNSGFAGKEEFYRSFICLESVDPALVSSIWVYNHYRWIGWKLAAYETSYPAQLAGRCLTPNSMMLQLKYRYDREVDRCHRSALKKIVERDDATCKRLVLCVSAIKMPQSGTDSEGTGQCVVELTDGWYCIKAQLDLGLAGLVATKKICVGQKICISGAELAGSQEACPPLEIPESLYLKIFMNSTRPAPGDSKLGYQRDPRPLCVPISTLHAEGGLAGCVDVVVTRIYPVMYMEKLVEGGAVFRTEEAEERMQRQFDRHKQDKMEKLYTEIQAGLEKDLGRGQRKSRKRWSQREMEDLQTGQEIYDAVEGSLQPEEVHSWLSEHQAQMMDNHRRHLQDLQHQQMQDKLHTAWEEAQQGHTSRNVTPVLKLRVSGCAKRDVDAKISSIVTVWRPNPQWLQLQEGKRYKIYGLVASPAKTRLDSHSVHLTANRQTKLQPCPVDENYLDLVYDQREVWSVKDLRSRSPPFKEFDFVGMVITTNSNSQRSCDTVYVSDIDGEILSIRFWAGLQSFGLEDHLAAGKSVVATNLILKWSRGSGVVSADACSEVTRFSSTTKMSDHRKCLARFTSFKQAEKSKFLVAARERLCEHERKAQAPHTQLATPEKYFSDLPSECLQKLFSPMEDQGEKLSRGDNSATPDPVVKKRRSILREKTAKLMAYSSPKPLSPISCPVSPAVARAFKLPSGLVKNMKDSFK